jgi:hypothetical protein
VPSLPPTAYKYFPNAATPTPPRCTFIGATVDHWFKWISYRSTVYTLHLCECARGSLGHLEASGIVQSTDCINGAL